MNAFAQNAPPTSNPAFAARAQGRYESAQIRYQAANTNATAAWQLGRACFDWAEFAADDEQREEIARQGMAVCRQLIAREPASAAGHYYLALNLGQLARTKSLGALRIVDEMELELKTALHLEPLFDYAGPDRSLGLLYLDAPGWPASIGSRSKARFHLEHAVELSPAFPDNRLSLLEAYLKWGDKPRVQRELPMLREILEKARTDLTGEDWEMSWADWEQRRRKIESKLKEKPVAPLRK
ncbi:MAG: hypothetical protein HY674_04380 [Chloroflexi bacterium]|nr:hypothetical protein [Chloroflexota bacterium]